MKKPLIRGCQQPPIADAKSKGLWPPKDGTPYKVTDADSFTSLARDWKIDVRWLMGYNFNTVEPPEVNWYLDNYVGCVKRTKDACNWRFSWDATPGIIYRPPAGYTPNKPAPGDPVVHFGDWEDPKIELPELPLTDHFSVRLHFGGGGGAKGVALDMLKFEIRNNKTFETAKYRYTGGGLGVSLLPVGGNVFGPWNRFHTSEPIMETDFEGFTRFTQAGVADVGTSILHLVGTPDDVDSVYIEDFDSGATLGAGASFTFGVLNLLV